MTHAEITAFVMALTPEQVDRACAECVMGWSVFLDFGEPWWGQLPEGYKHSANIF